MHPHFLWVIIFVSFLGSAVGHAYVYWPKSRQWANDDGQPHSHNKEVTGVPYKSQWTGESRWSKDMCGTGPPWKPGDSLGGWAGEPVATYEQGSNITFTVVVNGEHGGRYEFRVCPKKVDSSMTLEEAAKCLDTYLIGRSCVPKCGCRTDRCRDNPEHNDPTDPIFAHGPPKYMLHGAHQVTFQLPSDLHCEHCTVQWYWPTAFGEWFRNCIDIRIKAKDPMTPPPSPAPTSPPAVRRRRSSRRRRRRSIRRRSSRRRGSRRRSIRRRSSRRRSRKYIQGATGQSKEAHKFPFEVDLEYEELGCFTLAEGDGKADKLDGKGSPTPEALRDFTCMKHNYTSSTGPCRSGLPFYRFHVEHTRAARHCFHFCSSKGLDLFGLIKGDECRCGATLANSKIWKVSDMQSAHPSLLFNYEAKAKECDDKMVRLFRYIGWMRYDKSEGVQDPVLDLTRADQDYIASVINGRQYQDGQPVT